MSKCRCHRCWEDATESLDVFERMMSRPFIVCPKCGNKRCPRASDHRHACTNSNEPGQPGSIYE